MKFQKLLAAVAMFSCCHLQVLSAETENVSSSAKSEPGQNSDDKKSGQIFPQVTGKFQTKKVTVSSITEEAAKTKGEVGIAVIDTSRHKQFILNANKAFPMQSVCKLPISIAILRLADEGKLSVDDKITVHKTDLVPYHSPIKESLTGQQSDFTIRNLITRAICDSDNTACDILIAHAGGTKEVTRLLVQSGIKGVRVDRPEGTLQPDSLAIAKYLADPRDTALPAGMVDLLQKLYTGKLLSKKSTALLLEDLFNCKTGANRLTAGLPTGWKLAHKTGTGLDVSGQNAATNDVGLMVGPEGETIYMAVFIKGARARTEVLEAFIAKVASKAVAGEL